MLKKTILLIGLVLVVSCGGNIPSVKTLAQHQQNNPAAFKNDASYVIGPGDVLSIDVWKEPALSKQVTIRLDGKTSLPLVNDVTAAGLTCAELRQQLIEKYKDYVDVPEISVTVVASLSKKIYLLGNVTRPGEYALQKNMTFVQGISKAGGLAEFADTSDILLIRRIDGKEQTFIVDYDAIISSKDLSQNIQLRPDDTIYVP
jgi:polysaccharide export outer membrane protein